MEYSSNTSCCLSLGSKSLLFRLLSLNFIHGVNLVGPIFELNHLSSRSGPLFSYHLPSLVVFGVCDDPICEGLVLSPHLKLVIWSDSSYYRPLLDVCVHDRCASYLV